MFAQTADQAIGLATLKVRLVGALTRASPVNQTRSTLDAVLPLPQAVTTTLPIFLIKTTNALGQRWSVEAAARSSDDSYTGQLGAIERNEANFGFFLCIWSAFKPLP